MWVIFIIHHWSLTPSSTLLPNAPTARTPMMRTHTKMAAKKRNRRRNNKLTTIAITSPLCARMRYHIVYTHSHTHTKTMSDVLVPHLVLQHILHQTEECGVYTEEWILKLRLLLVLKPACYFQKDKSKLEIKVNICSSGHKHQMAVWAKRFRFGQKVLFTGFLAFRSKC